MLFRLDPEVVTSAIGHSLPDDYVYPHAPPRKCTTIPELCPGIAQVPIQDVGARAQRDSARHHLQSAVISMPHEVLTTTAPHVLVLVSPTHHTDPLRPWSRNRRPRPSSPERSGLAHVDPPNMRSVQGKEDPAVVVRDPALLVSCPVVQSTARTHAVPPSVHQLQDKVSTL